MKDGYTVSLIDPATGDYLSPVRCRSAADAVKAAETQKRRGLIAHVKPPLSKTLRCNIPSAFPG